jgi:hypothetical protein
MVGQTLHTQDKTNNSKQVGFYWQEQKLQLDRPHLKKEAL